MRAAVRMFGWSIVAVAVAGMWAVHQRVPWIPRWYLAALVLLPVAVRWAIAGRFAGGAARWMLSGAGAMAFIALCLVPWMTARLDHPPGTVWRLDGGLVIDSQAVDPPGDWYWLTAGRPPVVAEVVGSWITGDAGPTNLLNGRRSSRPVYVEPAAAAVGLRRAGWGIESRVLVEVSGPTVAELPGRALLATINGAELSDRPSFDKALGGLGATNTLTTAAGDTISFAGGAIPFRRVDVIEQPTRDLGVTLGGWLARTPAGRWFRNLSVGASDGLMIALVSYVHASGDDLAAGRSIAGTGGIRGDGTVRSIGHLVSKAEAARDAGIDVLLFPAAQTHELAGFDPDRMQLFPVASLDEAIAVLSGVAA